MKLHNTLSRTVEAFQPYNKKQVTIYSCGPTVYDHIHIGNLRAFVAADLLRRAFVASGSSVKHVMNFTDVDDKTIRRSREQYPDDAPEVALQQLTRNYETIFTQDMAAIGNDVTALDFVRATDSIPAMQELITELYRQGVAYIADDGVYFSIEAYRRSGKTYGQLLEITITNTSEARIDNDEYDKESVHDFALWKTRRPGEPAWEFVLDGHDLLGRPGWHIECSAMSSRNLGQPFDIHTGGVDLIFPHHENEIAQSTGTTTDPVYARYFVHNEHLLVDGRKMSKSLGNFFTLRDIQEKGFEPLAFRLLVLQAHYRSQLNFSWANLEAAASRLQRWRQVAVLRFQYTDGSADHSNLLVRQTKALETAMQNDLDTPAALAAIETAFTAVENGLPEVSKKPFKTLLSTIDANLGLGLLQQPDVTPDITRLLADRHTARSQQNWQESDRLRDELADHGIGVRDTAQNQVWFWL